MEHWNLDTKLLNAYFINFVHVTINCELLSSGQLLVVDMNSCSTSFKYELYMSQ